MAEETRIFTMQDGTVRIAALGGGAYNSAGTLISGANEYEVDFDDGDLSVTFPRRTVAHYKTRGRVRSLPSVRFGEDELGSFTFNAKYRDSANSTDETLMDILLWAAGLTSGNVGANWESTNASSAGAGDADVPLVALKWTFVDEGDATHTKIFAFNQVEMGPPQIGEGEFNNISISGVIHDRIENIIAV